MLQRKTVAPHTFAILTELMAMPDLNNFQLVGGTALSLQLGHRISVDIDLFSNFKFDNEKVIEILKTNFGERYIITSRLMNKLGIFGLLDGVKLDICRHPYPLIEKIIVEENIRMWSLREIAAARVNAISRRATKKDFWDIDILLDYFTISEISIAYRKKYNPMIAIGVAQMITYYTEADDSPIPNCLLGKTWLGVQKSIFKKINEQTK